MAQEDVEVVKRALEAYRDRDIEALLPFLDEAIEFSSAIVGPAEGNRHRGHEQMREWHADSLESFDELVLELSEFRDLGDRVLAFGRIRARGRESGLELDSPTGWVFTVRDGVVTTMQGYLDPQRATEAAALDRPDTQG
jgi:ketosteroid isomerase-like protein